MSRNPFNPGSGTTPPYLAGRDADIEKFERILNSVKDGHPRNALLSGLRGTGKTVLLQEFQRISLRENFLVVRRLQYSRKYCDPFEFEKAFKFDIRTSVESFSRLARAKGTAQVVLSYVKPKQIGIPEVIYYEPAYEHGKSVPFEDHLKSYLSKNWQVFDRAGYNGVAFLFDEFHEVVDVPRKHTYVLADFIGAINDVQRDGCKYFCALAGLPNLILNVKEARSYTERMFNFLEVGNLSRDDATKAITEPLRSSGYSFTDKLVGRIVAETEGYPYFLQFYGNEIINNSQKTEIEEKDFDSIKPLIVNQLDDGFFSPRFDTASKDEQNVLCSMVRIKSNDMRFGEIRKASHIDRRKLSNYLKRLGEKGLVYQHHKEVYRFSLPLLRDFLTRRCSVST